jgi:hypothetical protein
MFPSGKACCDPGGSSQMSYWRPFVSIVIAAGQVLGTPPSPPRSAPGSETDAARAPAEAGPEASRRRPRRSSRRCLPGQRKGQEARHPVRHPPRHGAQRHGRWAFRGAERRQWPCDVSGATFPQTPSGSRTGTVSSAHDDSASYRPAGCRRGRERSFGDRASERDVPLVSCLDRGTGASRSRGAQWGERPYPRAPDHWPCPSDRRGHRWWCSIWLSRAAWRIW